MGITGYDVIYVDDISATTSPEAAYGMVRYNSNLDGKSDLGICARGPSEHASSQLSPRFYRKQQRHYCSVEVSRECRWIHNVEPGHVLPATLSSGETRRSFYADASTYQKKTGGLTP